MTIWEPPSSLWGPDKVKNETEWRRLHGRHCYSQYRVGGTSSTRVPVSLPLHQHLAVLVFLTEPVEQVLKPCYIRVFVGISLMTKDREHFFTSLLAICIYSCEIPIQVSCPFLLVCLFINFLCSQCNTQSVLNVLYKYFSKYFSRSVGCLLIS